MDIREYLKDSRLLADGAFGTYYAQLTNYKGGLSERANILDPELVKKIHRDYIEAGAGFIRSNTFAANRAALESGRKEVKEVLCRGWQLAKEAVFESGKEIFIAADIGPVQENLNLDADETEEEYRFICDTFLECGAEVFLFETFSDIRYIKPMAEYIKQRSNAFVAAEFCLNRYGYTRAGIKGKRLLEMISSMEAIDAVGFNCGIGSGHMYQIMKDMNLKIGKYIFAMPNSNYPELMQDRAVYLDNSQYFSGKMKEIAGLGVDVVGGCCGTTPDYIKAVEKEIRGMEKPAKQEKKAAGENNKKPGNNENSFYRKLKEGKKVIAVELDPPYDAKFDRILECAYALKAAGADILTFADSPMARPRVDSILTGIRVQQETDIPVMPHISCRDRNRIAMRAQLLGGYINGIRNLLLVTGDPIPGNDRLEVSSVFDFNSIRLMQFLSEMNEEHLECGPFFYGGAVNYARPRIEVEIERMKKKIDAGASFFLTQPVFSDEDVGKLKYIKERVDTRLLCGIMPLISFRNASFIQNEITGIHVPHEVVQAFRPDMTREEGEETGTALAALVMKKLEHIADGFYFMLPFNRVNLVGMCMAKLEKMK